MTEFKIAGLHCTLAHVQPFNLFLYQPIHSSFSALAKLVMRALEARSRPVPYTSDYQIRRPRIVTDSPKHRPGAQTESDSPVRDHCNHSVRPRPQ